MNRHFILLGCLIWAALGASPATQPADLGVLELRATTAFNTGDYASALPLLINVRDRLSADTDQGGLIGEEIEVCRRQLAKPTSTQPIAPSGPPPEFPMSADKRKIHAPPRPGEVRVMEIKELGNFDYDADKGGNIPPDVMALSGMKVKLHGFMIPMDQTDKITSFALVPSLFACCYGQPPQIQHTIICSTPKGMSVSYYEDEVSVVGTLKVQEKKEDGYIVSIFQLAVTSVKPAANR